MKTAVPQAYNQFFPFGSPPTCTGLPRVTVGVEPYKFSIYVRTKRINVLYNVVDYILHDMQKRYSVKQT